MLLNVERKELFAKFYGYMAQWGSPDFIRKVNL